MRRPELLLSLVPCLTGAVVLLVMLVSVSGPAPVQLSAGGPRPDHPLRNLALRDAPPMPGPWTESYAENFDETASAWGLEENALRRWTRPDGVEFAETLRRFTSADTAAQYLVDRNRALVEQGEVVDYPPRQWPSGADEARYFCERGARGCEQWWIRTRYGQYVLELRSTEPTRRDEIPEWLASSVRAASHALTAVVPG
ncbi:hypothetical protein GCM10010470_42880 [Saccharopolyspora taberi]|uniref:Serine/threonine protein kinase n=1 Tax=Saccharopolyspora taberi TaxID=60895 RepID=A0ABN3VGL5_9PSEU